ncbi:MAG: signal peptidase I [Actinomycetota bacterium]|nr:signal peptidase I [Acidimicrobiia bacterium]MDQ3293178.1 signal peptidase I [Actinomycetota bacterium]
MRRAAVFLTVLIALLVPLVAALVSAWAQGWTLAAVETGSMRPGIAPGSMVALAPVDPADVGPGTVIAFRDDRLPSVVTHRVVEVLDQPSGRFFVTQGDANPRPDGRPVPARAVVGEVRWRVAGLGAVVGALTDHRTQVALIAVPLSLLAVSELAGLRGRSTRRRIAAMEAEIARLRRTRVVLRLRSSPQP